MTWARVGRKCVCINENTERRGVGDVSLPTHSPIKGEIYTISQIKVVEGEQCLLLCEIPYFQKAQSTQWSISGHVLWLTSDFRPLIDQDDDVAMFRHMLNTDMIPA